MCEDTLIGCLSHSPAWDLAQNPGTRALTRNRTSDLPIHRPMLSPLSRTNQGPNPLSENKTRRIREAFPHKQTHPHPTCQLVSFLMSLGSAAVTLTLQRGSPLRV